MKEFRTYEEQVDLLLSRGLVIEDQDTAIAQLQDVNYYRLSGYWYPFRKLATNGSREDDFFPGTRLADVLSLYNFDARLRTATFDALAPVELSIRARLGHELGELDECAHLNPTVLSVRASTEDYGRWYKKYTQGLEHSHEDFVSHHQDNYNGRLPVWAAVEILDLGSLRYLFGFAPRPVQDKVADHFGLRAPQLESWMRALEIVRNACAHHGRLYNRVYTKAPKLPTVGKYPALDEAGPFMTRTFGQLTLIQHMRDAQGTGMSRMLSAVLASYPAVKLVPKSHVGLPSDWDDSPLWAR